MSVKFHNKLGKDIKYLSDMAIAIIIIIIIIIINNKLGLGLLACSLQGESWSFHLFLGSPMSRLTSGL
ncbi:hypothetical protein C0J52_22448 [Blattella germanica]|nr:hypothetical protein C0J52_22448 [Blattella germanica]